MAGNREFADCACFNLRRAARRITQTYDHALSPAGVTATQFSLLAVLAGISEGATISGLAERLGTDRTTLTRNLAVVERDGLIAIKPGADPRSKTVLLTKKGRAVFDHAAPLWRKAQSREFDRLGEDWSSFLSMTQRVAAG